MNGWLQLGLGGGALWIVYRVVMLVVTRSTDPLRAIAVTLRELAVAQGVMNQRISRIEGKLGIPEELEVRSGDADRPAEAPGVSVRLA